eukprot:SAG31_NODE_30488_length_380_cov_1.106762_1_plen_34_part_01
MRVLLCIVAVPAVAAQQICLDGSESIVIGPGVHR